ncbi:BTB/POZ domain-containing protein KCTD15-like [Haliotis asinina]|uniref:BTB/POZ domain-containing protein KCTD15-like n=1 Tax=Haliotis asinina TaxID=109174 RepID=UPI003531B8B0
MMCDSVITLNVGGILYTTTKSTLSKYPDSMLGAMISGKFPMTQDQNGHMFIDRDGQIFRHILNFLRSTRLALPAQFSDYDLLLIEADFYQISPLIDAVNHALENKCEKLESHYLEIIEMRTGLSATMPTNNSRIKTVLSGRKDVILTLPEQLIGEEAKEKLREKSGNEFIEVELNSSSVRLRFCEVLKNRGWVLINSDLSSSSGISNAVQGKLHHEHSYRDRWRIDVPQRTLTPAVSNGDMIENLEN